MWIKKLKLLQASQLISIALLVLFMAAGITAAVNIIIIRQSYAAADKEYEELRQYTPLGIDATTIPSDPPGAPLSSPEPTPDLFEINPDYIGWMRIEGTGIDYPVVQGQDNEYYLNTTFTGERNPSGAIFMDYIHAEGFDAPLTVIYGHNMKDGSMFAALSLFLDDEFFAEHTQINIITLEGELLTYRIFAATVSDITDKAYELIGGDMEAIKAYMATLGAPERAEQYLLLSTCTSNNDDSERLLVFAARELS
jgi:sortase B